MQAYCKVLILKAKSIRENSINSFDENTKTNFFVCASLFQSHLTKIQWSNMINCTKQNAVWLNQCYQPYFMYVGHVIKLRQ